MVSKAGSRPSGIRSYQPISGSRVTISNRLGTMQAEAGDMPPSGAKYRVEAGESTMLLFCGNHAQASCLLWWYQPKGYTPWDLGCRPHCHHRKIVLMLPHFGSDNPGSRYPSLSHYTPRSNFIRNKAYIAHSAPLWKLLILF